MGKGSLRSGIVCVEGLLEEPERLRPDSVEGCETVETHPPHVVHIAHARVLERTRGRGADGGKRSRIPASDTTNRTTVPTADHSATSGGG